MVGNEVRLEDGEKETLSRKERRTSTCISTVSPRSTVSSWSPPRFTVSSWSPIVLDKLNGEVTNPLTFFQQTVIIY